ncbi:MAG: HEAT repeat domain-containing protein [Ignavibacteriales bacterium]|nr:HEAT repeat domain-containing protein [Ignavibacteriales bacterium]
MQTHEQYKERLLLSIHGELEADEQKKLESHVADCRECREELAHLKRLQVAVAALPRVSVTDSLLQEARRELRAAIRIERNRTSLGVTVGRFLERFMAPWVRLSAGAAAFLAVGFLGGALMFRSDVSNGGPILKQLSDQTEVLRGEAEITNVRFEDADPSDGEIAFSFHAVSPVKVRGNPNDPGIQSVLTKALMYEENPGVRLRAVSAITSQIQIQLRKEKGVDNEVKIALINAMKYDENPGVRKEALHALRKFPFDDEIKQGLLYVLTRDRNQGLRVEAINSLATAKDEFRSSDEQLLDVLRRKMETDNNQYVRLQARAVFEEVRQQ